MLSVLTDGNVGAGRREIELSVGAKTVSVADDKGITGKLVDITEDTTAGVGTIASAVEYESDLGAVTDVAPIAGGGTTAGARVDTTGCTTAGASERAGFADKSTGGAVGIRGLDSSVGSVTRGSNTDGRIEGPNWASRKPGELLPEGVGSSPRIIDSSSPSDSLTLSRLESRGLSRENGGTSVLLDLRTGLCTTG